MFSSEAISRETSRNGRFSNEGQVMKSRDSSMGSDLFLNQAQIEQSNQQGCGLARYRSAPSSFLASLLDSTTDNSNSSSGDESETLLSALMNGPTPNQKEMMQHHYQLKQEIGAESEARPPPGSMSMMGYESGGGGGGGGAVVGSYSVGMDNQVNLRMNSLVRQSSSPAGFFNGNFPPFFLWI